MMINAFSLAFATEEMDSQSIAEKKMEISASYEIGERLSDEDAEFIKTYADIMPSGAETRTIFERSIDSLFKTDMKDATSGVSVIFTGSLIGKIDPGKISGNYFGVKNGRSIVYGDNKSRLVSQKIVVECTCYGLAGDGGLIKAYDGSINSGKQTTDVVTMNKTQSFSAIMATYATVSAYVDVVAKTSTGATNSFRVNAKLM